jgi:hypothetical protein
MREADGQPMDFEAMNSQDYMSKMDKADLVVKPIMGQEFIQYYRSLHERCKPLVEVARKAR